MIPSNIAQLLDPITGWWRVDAPVATITPYVVPKPRAVRVAPDRRSGKPLSPDTRRVLAFITHHPRLLFTEIRLRAGIPKDRASTIINHLWERGYVTRDGDPGAYRYEASAKGESEQQHLGRERGRESGCFSRRSEADAKRKAE